MNSGFLHTDQEERLVGLVRQFCRHTFVLVRVTETMLEKGIIDASASIRNLLKQNKIIDYEDIEDGKGNRQFLQSLILVQDGTREAKTSHYRPDAKPGKRGDPRFWIYGLKKLVQPGTLLCLSSLENRLIIIPITENNITHQNLLQIFPDNNPLEFKLRTKLVQYRKNKETKMAKGQQLIEALKNHVVETMEGMPECKANVGNGAGNSEIEEIAGISANLDKQNGWVCWSILNSLANNNAIEVVPGTETRRRWRLK